MRLKLSTISKAGWHAQRTAIAGIAATIVQSV